MSDKASNQEVLNAGRVNAPCGTTSDPGLRQAGAPGESPALLPCPFCRQSALKFWDSREAHEECEGPHTDGSNDVTWAVVCDATNHGCGASAGFQPTKHAAAARWNARVSGETGARQEALFEDMETAAYAFFSTGQHKVAGADHVQAVHQFAKWLDEGAPGHLRRAPKAEASPETSGDREERWKRVVSALSRWESTPRMSALAALDAIRMAVLEPLDRPVVKTSGVGYGANCRLHPGAMFKPSDGCPTCEVGGAPYVLDSKGNAT